MLKAGKFLLMISVSISLSFCSISVSFATEDPTFSFEGAFKQLKSTKGKHLIFIDGKWYTLQSSTKITLCGTTIKWKEISDYKDARVNFTLTNADSDQLTQLNILCE